MSLKNNINHSCCHWCLNIPLEEFLEKLPGIGVSAIDLMSPTEWPLLKEHGIHCAMCNGAEISLEAGWNNLKNHDELIKNYSEMIPKVAAAGYKNLICFSGNRNGLDDETGLNNCVLGLEKIMPLAEKHGVIIQMELFNQQDHPDYMCDSTAWGVELCKKLGLNFKLLYDIYHMQIQEGDIINTILNNHFYIGHYHTAGVPGRHNIDATQELNYTAIMKAIASTGYTGYVAQEFIPKETNHLKALETAIKICDI